MSCSNKRQQELPHSCVKVTWLHGDEFVLILENLTYLKDDEIVALKVIAELNVPFQLSENDCVQIGEGIGISPYPRHGSTPEKLIDNADTALYRAKGNGRSCFGYFSPTGNEQ